MEPSSAAPVRFSDAVKTASGGSEVLEFSPALLAALEPFIDKARRLREERRALDSRLFSNAYPDLVLHEWRHGLPESVTRETVLRYDVELFPLAAALCASLGLPADSLPRFHESCGKDASKRIAFAGITAESSRAAFQIAFTDFVLGFAAPHVAEATGCDVIYYQCFPCVRVVRPGEFSIRPHSDTAYSFSPANINMWVPLVTLPPSTACLHTESHPGAEDWHPMHCEAGTVTRFWGAQCIHWSPENTTGITRVSLDFRLIPGNLWLPLHDQYSREEGYYCIARRPAREGAPWVRDPGPLPTPDHRVGFPFV